MSSDPFNLFRFVEAQADHYHQALRELRAGQKTSHWIWFIFPQISGLGESPTSRRYAVASLQEARAYLSHPLLGPRLQTCAEAILGNQQRSAREVLGYLDALKLRSCATLFELAAPADSVFSRLLDAHFDGERDAETLRLLEMHS